MPNPAPKAAIFLNSSETTSTKFIYLTNITQLIGRARESSVSWSRRNSRSHYRVKSSDSQRSHAYKFWLTLSPITRNWKMMISRKLIGGWRNQFRAKPLSKNSSSKLNGTKKYLRFKICIRLYIFSLWRPRTSKNAGSIKMIYGSGSANRDSTKHRVILNLTLREHLKRHKDTPGFRRPKDMLSLCNPQKPTWRCLQKLNRTTQWRL